MIESDLLDAALEVVAHLVDRRESLCSHECLDAGILSPAVEARDLVAAKVDRVLCAFERGRRGGQHLDVKDRAGGTVLCSR